VLARYLSSSPSSLCFSLLLVLSVHRMRSQPFLILLLHRVARSLSVSKGGHPNSWHRGTFPPRPSPPPPRVASRRTRRIGLPRAAFARALQRTQGCDTELHTWPSAWPRAERGAYPVPLLRERSSARRAGRGQGGQHGQVGQRPRAHRWAGGLPAARAGRGGCPLPGTALAEGAARCPRWPRGLPAARTADSPLGQRRTGPSAWPRAPGPRPNAAHSPCRSLSQVFKII